MSEQLYWARRVRAEADEAVRHAQEARRLADLTARDLRIVVVLVCAAAVLALLSVLANMFL